VLASGNEGASWSGGPVDGVRDFVSVSAHEQAVAAASLDGVWLSSDEAAHWSRLPLPAWVTRIYSVSLTGDGALWLGTREGALRWTGKVPGSGTWEHVLNGLPGREVPAIRDEGGALLAVATGSQTAYVSRNQGQSWEAEPGAGFEVTGAIMQGETLYITTRHHGVLVRESGAAADLRPDGK
jgi:hypothetical protein